MNNSELIRTLNRKDLLTIVELLSFALRYPEDDFEEFDYYSGFPTDEVFDHCKGLTDYERLKLIQLIINTLVHEAEQSAVQHFQPLLPLKPEAFYRP